MQVVDLEREVGQQEVGFHPRAEGLALSRDGRWVASAGWHSDRARVWGARTGAMVREWVDGFQTEVAFTPDSRSLITSQADEYTFWEAQTWKCVRRLRRDVAVYPGQVAFSPDGRLMA